MYKPLLLLLLLSGMPLLGCSGDDNLPQPILSERPPADPPPADPPPPSPPPMPTADVGGTWYSRTVNNAVNCDAGEFIDAQVFAITQNDTEFSLLTSTGNTLAGTINGDIIEWTGDITERNGTTTFTSVSLIVSGNSAAGNTAWTWTDGTDSCNGTMAITASRDWGVQSRGANTALGNGQLIEFIDDVAFFHGSVNAVTDTRDAFSLVLDADATVQVELSHFSLRNSNLDIDIIDENFNQVALASSNDSWEILEAQLQAGVTYYIAVLATSTTGDSFYQLSVDVN